MQPFMETPWLRRLATSQIEAAEKRLEHAETVAVACDPLQIGAHGKEESTVRVVRRLEGPANCNRAAARRRRALAASSAAEPRVRAPGASPPDTANASMAGIAHMPRRTSLSRARRRHHA